MPEIGIIPTTHQYLKDLNIDKSKIEDINRAIDTLLENKNFVACLGLRMYSDNITRRDMATIARNSNNIKILLEYLTNLSIIERDLHDENSLQELRYISTKRLFDDFPLNEIINNVDNIDDVRRLKLNYFISKAVLPPENFIKLAEKEERAVWEKELATIIASRNIEFFAKEEAKEQLKQEQ